MRWLVLFLLIPTVSYAGMDFSGMTNKWQTILADLKEIDRARGQQVITMKVPIRLVEAHLNGKLDHEQFYYAFIDSLKILILYDGPFKKEFEDIKIRAEANGSTVYIGSVPCTY